MDGVPDHRDACPETSPPALVDKLGCFVMLDEIVRITLDVEFDFDSAASRPEHAIEVKKVADFMMKYPLTKVTLEGHTDSKGSDAYNKVLSERRAATIGKMLVERFNISSDRVNTVGYGEDRPIAPNDTAQNRQRNRRVVAEIEAVEQVKQRL
ncbi:MAG: OmpA family protein [Gammaproteobacteria bacterium]|nr:OmpA family protein [Gammaproteobacteria bacterium]